MYKVKRFANIYNLKNFLNDNGIKQTNIIGIYREQNYCDLLYVDKSESEDKK
jgi:hypothetical protein